MAVIWGVYLFGITTHATLNAEADLNNQQKYLIAQLKDLSVKTNKLRADLDQVQRAADSFQKELLESFKKVAEEIIEKDTEKAS